MSVFFIANIKLTDQVSYAKYLEECANVFKLYNGEYLAVDDNPTILEGDWAYTKAVLIRFPSREDLLAWYFSEAYQRILKYRLSGAECDTIVVNGLEPLLSLE